MKNEVVLLGHLLSEGRIGAPKELSDSEYFEFFSAEQVLKDYDLSGDGLLAGRVGGGNDGGVDGFYSLLNGELLDEDSDLESVKRNPDLRLYVIQARQTGSFQASTFDRVSATMRELLDLGRDRAALEAAYCEGLVERAMVFRDALVELAGRHPQVSATFVLATKGATANIHRNVRIKAQNLESDFRDMLPNCSAKVVFLGARELLEAARRQPSYTVELTFTESPISVADSYIVLAKLRDYFRFISDESGALRKYIFESNVRDYQGNVEVNNDIRGTLQEDEAPEFWWLNNGVTIIASKASITGKVVALDDVQIVNGLQTSLEIYNHVAANPDAGEERSILCRIIVTGEAPTRDRIIKATNFQTAVSAASLKATDRIQRDIETHFLSEKWYYDRRKNYYKNLGRPADRIVSIPYLAQAVMAMGLGEPDNSRARPTSLIKNPDDYVRVFGEDVNLAIYLWTASTMKRVDSFLRSAAAPGGESEKRELRFYLAMWATVRALGRKVHHPSQLQDLVGVSFTDRELEDAMQELLSLLKAFPDTGVRPLDRIAKTRDFVDYLFSAKFGDGGKSSGSDGSNGAGTTKATKARPARRRLRRQN